MFTLLHKHRRTLHKIYDGLVHSAITIHATGPSINSRKYRIGKRLALCITNDIRHVRIPEAQLSLVESRDHGLKLFVEFFCSGGIAKAFLVFRNCLGIAVCERIQPNKHKKVQA